ncbi:MAG: hypothetical protein ACK4ND_06500 [Cytophagaceae bacterium]
MEETLEKKEHIRAWGSDADPKNDPTYPMRDRTHEEKKGYNWDRPTQQKTDIEVLHSNERPNLSAVFGTSVPPSGISGRIRRYAFQFGEGSYVHWLPLMFADRINVIEGVVDDIKRGHIPNIFAEKGMKAELKYNKLGLLRRVLIASVVSSAVAAYFYSKLSSNKTSD